MSGTGEKEDDTSNLNEFVSRSELLVFLEQAQKNTNRAIATQIAAAFANLNITNMFESLDRRVSALDDRIHALETRPPPQQEPPNQDDDLRRRPHHNHHGMEGNNHARDDPFAKVKFSIPSFAGAYDADAYLDWEMQVEQKFNSHLVLEIHRVRQATSEFKDFALIWWTELARTTGQPETWAGLKDAMRDRFVPTSYRRDLRQRLQRLEQGDMSVEEYYAELQKGMIRCGVEEDTEDKIYRFFGGLRNSGLHHHPSARGCLLQQQ